MPHAHPHTKQDYSRDLWSGNPEKENQNPETWLKRHCKPATVGEGELHSSNLFRVNSCPCFLESLAKAHPSQKCVSLDYPLLPPCERYTQILVCLCDAGFLCLR